MSPQLPAQVLDLPVRPPGAPDGREFVEIIRNLSLTEREHWIFAQVTAGNVPDFLRTLVPISVSVTISGSLHTATYYVTPDYVAIGTDLDYFLTPMTPLLAQRLSDALGCTLPTRKMVNQIWTNAAVKMNPQPIPWSAEMVTVPVFAEHNAMVRTQRNGFLGLHPLGSLVAGDKKDVIVSARIYTNFANAGITRPVVIYGWHYPGGAPIQPLYNGHEETYADYSHGARLVQSTISLDGGAATVTGVLTNPALAALFSDETSAEGSSDGTIRVPRYTAPGIGPVVVGHPRSQTVLPGATAAFRVHASGNPPLTFSWQRNGTNLPGANAPVLTLTDLSSDAAGVYTVLVNNLYGTAISRPAWLRLNPARDPVLFADGFDGDSSGGWSVVWGATNGIPDYTADFGWRYGAVAYTFNGVTAVIPPAPNSPESTSRGLRLAVNNNDLAAAIAGVNLYPKGQWFKGDFTLKFDLWINYPGAAGGAGAAGSTEHAIFGVNHLGTQVNWIDPAASSSDGVWFAADGEGGTTRDYRAYVGHASGGATELTGASGGFVAQDFASPFFAALFPGTRFETVGAPGKNWVEVEIRQADNQLVWLLDGTIVAQRVNTSSFNHGNVMLGFMDTFNSIASPASAAFALFDNVRVEEPGGTPCCIAVSVAGGQVRTVWSAVPGRRYALQNSLNLTNWLTGSSQIASNAPVQFVEPLAGCGFYRLLEIPP